jgi:hypothetical protein
VPIQSGRVGYGDDGKEGIVLRGRIMLMVEKPKCLSITKIEGKGTEK